MLQLSTRCSLLTSVYYLIFIVPLSPTHVVLSLAVVVGAEGYFRFSPEHEQWVELVDGTSSETNVISFNGGISGVRVSVCTSTAVTLQQVGRHSRSMQGPIISLTHLH